MIDKVILVLSVGGVVIQMIPVFGSGFLGFDGIRFFGISRYDGVMHLSFIQSITHTFPPVQPGAAGNLITNYHYWSDLIIAEIARVWHVPITHLFFRFFPLLLSVMTAVGVYEILEKWRGSTTVKRWGVFLLFFGADAPFLFTLILNQQFGFGTPAIDNGATQFLNMPHVFAKAIFAVGVLAFFHWKEKLSVLWFAITMFLFAPLVGLKIYFGIFAFFGMAVVLAGEFLRGMFSRHSSLFFSVKQTFTQNKSQIAIFLLACGFAALIFFPVNKSAGGLYLAPLEWPRLILGSSSLNLLPWWGIVRYAQQQGMGWLLVFMDAVAICITLVTIYGTRIIGLFPTKVLLQRIGFSGVLFFIPGLILFNILGLFTLQVSGDFNVFNFFAVSAFVFVLITPFTLELITSKLRKLGALFIGIIVLLTVPRIISETATHLSYYITKQESYLVSNNDLAAYNYVRSNTEKDAVIQTHPMYLIDMRVPYTAFFTDRYTYLTGIEAQETHNQPIKERKKDLIDILFRAPNSYDFLSKLKERNIRYVLLHKNDDEILFFTPSEGHYNTVFENDSVIVLEPKPGV